MSTIRIATEPHKHGPQSTHTTRVWVDGWELSHVCDIQVKFPLGGAIAVTLELFPEHLEIQGEAKVEKREVGPLLYPDSGMVWTKMDGTWKVVAKSKYERPNPLETRAELTRAYCNFEKVEYDTRH